jgi:hypothetical protein
MRHAILALALALATPALAQPAEPAANDPWSREPTSTWTISFEPRLWYAGTAGDINFPGGTVANDQIDLSDLNMDSPRSTPYGELKLQRGKLRIAIAGSAFDASTTSNALRTETLGSVALFAGETSALDFSTWTAEARALYLLYSYIDGTTDDGRDILRARVLVGGGLRVSSINLDFAVTPTSGARTGAETLALSYDQVFAEPILAVAMELDLHERFMFSLNATAGAFGTGDTTSASFTIEPALIWHPKPNIGLEIGYKMHIYRLKDGNDPAQFEWSGSIAGLYGGVSVRF